MRMNVGFRPLVLLAYLKPGGRRVSHTLGGFVNHSPWAAQGLWKMPMVGTSWAVHGLPVVHGQPMGRQ